MNPEQKRLANSPSTQADWKKWGTYLPKRQWGTVREDYSEDGEAWTYFPFDQASYRVYRWGEDGIGGWTDRECRLCFAPAFWNGQDPILKERLFGLSGPEGNHGEDVKELYYQLDNTPTHSYASFLYKYPHARFPYEDLRQTNAGLDFHQREYEILDTGIFDDGNYFDCYISYAKRDEESTQIRIEIVNRGVQKAPIAVLPTFWFRNEWAFKEVGKPRIALEEVTSELTRASVQHETLGQYYLYFKEADSLIFTENEHNLKRLFDIENKSLFTKDAFYHAVIDNDFDAFEKKGEGTKTAAVYAAELEAGATYTVELIISPEAALKNPFGKSFNSVFDKRRKEAETFYADLPCMSDDPIHANIQRQAFAGLLWNKQFYYYDVERWLNGDPGFPALPEARLNGRNSDWTHFKAKDILSMPDSWEFPWFAAWDLAFHCIPLAYLDAGFAKEQLTVLLSDRYFSPHGEIPAYEWGFDDINPPVHCWAAIQVFEIDCKQQGTPDYVFLQQQFEKLHINYQWWKSQQDSEGKNLFTGGFLGLDNIGIFNRSRDLFDGQRLDQADATNWMAMFTLHMLKMSLHLCQYQKPEYLDHAKAYFQYFLGIAVAINADSSGKRGLWDEETGFFYDVLRQTDGSYVPLKIKSAVGLTALFPVLYLDRSLMDANPEFLAFIKESKVTDYHKEHILTCEWHEDGEEDFLLCLMYEDRLKRILEPMLDESEFLSFAGIRSMSKRHQDGMFIELFGKKHFMSYEPGEGFTALYGGNSNWRGPIWFPINYLLVESLAQLGAFFGQDFQAEFPTDSGAWMPLDQVSDALRHRLVGIFAPNKKGHRPLFARHSFYTREENKDLLLFYEFFNGDSARGCGASHQTGWTGLVALLAGKQVEKQGGGD